MIGNDMWEVKCRLGLLAALEDVRSVIGRHLNGKTDHVSVTDVLQKNNLPQEQKNFDQVSKDCALDRLCKAFELSGFERSILLLCVGMELCPDFPALCAAVNGNARLSYPTFAMALSVFANPEWSALVPSLKLRRWRLIEVGTGERITASPLRIDERILHYLLGVPFMDERLQGLIEPISASAELPYSQQQGVIRIAEAWAPKSELVNLPIIQICGNDSSGKRAVASAACALAGLQLWGARSMDIPAIPAEREAFARLWEREALLSESALLIDEEEMGLTERLRSLLPFLESTQAFVFVTCNEPLRTKRRRIVRIEVNRPKPEEQKAIWKNALGSAVKKLNGHIDLITSQFDFSSHSITLASEEALEHWQKKQTNKLDTVLWEACRRQARPRLDDLAHRIQPAASWRQLVLPDAHLQVLRNIAAHVRRRSQVYDSWGFAGNGPCGLGISALFSGPSGTGKTMAAEVLANELNLDLYRIDLSAMVSKYIGETEKNLRRLFDAAEEGSALLLFDEADALFGKRSEVKDSHDRYANIEVSYLLQRIEVYRGLAILTSNLKNALDPAFLRRIRFIIHFPFPDASQRKEIWQRIFPKNTPTDRLNLDKLARLNLSGGNIHNLALNAAFLAADEGEPVRMKHLLAAAQGEYAKLEKTLSDSEIGGWV